MSNQLKLDDPRVLAACRVAGIAPEQVQAVGLSPAEIFLTVEGMGVVRVEIGALGDQPVNTQALSGPSARVTRGNLRSRGKVGVRKR